MNNLRFLYPIAVISQHTNSSVVGRTRLQKTFWLLQRLKLTTDYAFRMHHYGPYSEDLQAEIGLLEGLGLVKETAELVPDGYPRYILTAEPKPFLPDISPFFGVLKIMEECSSVVLELAATYDALRIAGEDHANAVSRLQTMKPEKCSESNRRACLEILVALGLQNLPPSNEH